jgi:hypothetical protein
MSSPCHWTDTRRTLAVALGLAVALLGVGVGPLAQPARAQTEEAQALTEAGRNAFAEQRYAEAAEYFAAAFTRDAHPIIRYNEARCYEELGDLPRALALFRETLAMGPDEQVQQASIDKILAVEEAMIERGYGLEDADPAALVDVSVLRVTSIPSAARVFLGDTYVGTTPIEGLYLVEGSYEVTIDLDGYEPHRRTFDVGARRDEVVHAGLRRADGATDYIPPDPGRVQVRAPRPGMQVFLDEDLLGYTPIDDMPVAPGRYRVSVVHPDYYEWTTNIEVTSLQTTEVLANAEAKTVEEVGFGPRQWGYVTAGIAGGLLATGAVFGVLASADADRYAGSPNAPARAETRDTALRRALVADVSLGAGAATAAVALVLILTSDPPGTPQGGDDQLVRFDVAPSAGGLSFSLGGAF